MPSYTQLLELSSAGDLISFIGPDYTYLWVNERYLQAFTLDKSEVLGKSVADLFGKHQFEMRLKPAIDKALASESTQLNEWFDYPGLGKRFMEVNYLPYYGGIDTITGVVASVRDVTERITNADELEHLASFPELNPKPVIETTEKGHVLYQNPAAEHWFPNLEAEGTSHPLLSNFDVRVTQLKASGSTSMVRELDVDEKHLEQCISLVPSHQTVRIYVNDVTERKKGELFLAESQQRFRDYVEIASDWHWEMGPDLCFTLFSERVTALTGVWPSDLVGKSLLDVQAYDSEPEQWQEHIENLQNRRSFQDFRYPYRAGRTADGELRWLSTSGKPIFDKQGRFQGYRGVSRDITSEMEAQKALKESETRFRHLVQTLNESIVTADEQHRFVYVNDRFCEILGYESSALIGRNMIDFVHASNKDHFKEQLSMRRDTQSERYELAWNSHDGQPVYTLVSPSPVLDEKGQFKGSIAALTDIRDRKRYEAQLRQKTEALQRSNSELEQFAYVASHDLQEPLRKVQAFGERLEQQCQEALSETGADYLKRMRSAAARMQVLINDLLTFSRIATTSSGPTKTDLNVVLGGVIEDLEIRLDETGGRVEVNTLPVVNADQSQMRQLFQNLIGNALKYCRDGVPPVVKISAELSSNCAPSESSDCSTHCRIEVTDNGMGFEDKYRERIFGIFQRLHGRGRYEGTGVGLAVCKKICERHGGSIIAHSTPGAGSTFVVTLSMDEHKWESIH